MARHAAALRRSERIRKEIESRHPYGKAPGQGSNVLHGQPVPSPTGFDGYSGLDLNTTQFQPYYIQEQIDQLMDNRPMSTESAVASTPPMSDQSYPGSPMPPAEVHFLPLEGRSLFYDSSETDSQPCTPDGFGTIGEFGDMAMDPSIFFFDGPRGDIANYGGFDGE